jgi:hypothetical protein
MASRRTQVYLTAEQRRRIDERRRRDHRTLAEIVREALDAYLAPVRPDPDEALTATYGSMPNLKVRSRDEWDRG